MNTVLCDYNDGIYRVTLNRPDSANALNPEMIAELHDAFDTINLDPNSRLMVLSGEGKYFCAGADINWLKESMQLEEDENVNDALQLANLLKKLNSLTVTTMAKVNGSAFGGGIGLICCCDRVIAAESAEYTFSETLLGLLPATILPYIVNSVGVKQARNILLSSCVINAEMASQIGMVHEVVKDELLDEFLNSSLSRFKLTAPDITKVLKNELLELEGLKDLDVERTAKSLASVRRRKEAIEGVNAFFQKRKAGWVDKS